MILTTVDEVVIRLIKFSMNVSEMEVSAGVKKIKMVFGILSGFIFRLFDL